MTPPLSETTELVGIVKVRPLPTRGSYMLDHVRKGRRERVVVPAKSMSEAVGHAHALNGLLVQEAYGSPCRDPADLLRELKRKVTPVRVASPAPDPDALPVAVALDEAIGRSDGNERTRDDYRKDCRHFLEWLAAHRPAVSDWRDVGQAVVLDYLHAKRDDGLSMNRLKALFRPLSLASHDWTVREPRFENWAPVVSKRFPKGRPPKETFALSAEELRTFLLAVRAFDPEAFAFLATTALGGLRPSEAASLTLADVNLAKGTLNVRPNALKAWTKTEGSDRLLPMAGALLEVLREHDAARKVRDLNPEAPFLTTAEGHTWTAKRPDRWWQRHGRRFGMPDAFTPYALRATFITLAAEGGASLDSAAMYCGNAGSGVKAARIAQAHYRKETYRQLLNVAEAFDRGFGSRMAETLPGNAEIHMG